MLFFKWNSKSLGNFDIFAVLNENEKNQLLAHYKTENAVSASLSDTNEFFYLIN